MIVGSGKFRQDEQTKYVGFKAHFEGIELKSTLEMYLFEGGYLGISPIDEKTVNVACIIKKSKAKSFQIEEVCEKIKNGNRIFPQWLSGEIPEFGIRKTAHLENVFWIGDAAGTIPPITGEGLSIAISSGVLAANSLYCKKPQEFKKLWLKKYRRQFLLGMLLHQAVLNPITAKMGFSIFKHFPACTRYIYQNTRTKKTL